MNGGEDIATDSSGIKKMAREDFEQLHTSRSEQTNP